VPRQPRSVLPDGYLHLTSRGNRGQPIYLDSADRRAFLAVLADAAPRGPWRCCAYCLMTNHYHLFVHGEVSAISRALHRLNGVYAQRFNRRHALKGHLFEDRFHATPIGSDGHLLATVRYLALNPVRAGLCEEPTRWRWSSYAAALGLARRERFVDLEWMAELFGADDRASREILRALVEA
jgi:putative transposase